MAEDLVSKAEEEKLKIAVNEWRGIQLPNAIQTVAIASHLPDEVKDKFYEQIEQSRERTEMGSVAGLLYELDILGLIERV